jgi:hypothetical protein
MDLVRHSEQQLLDISMMSFHLRRYHDRRLLRDPSLVLPEAQPCL